MRFFVAITDFDWFTYLSAQKPDEVNFWQPSASNQFRVLQPGEPLLFKLHSPRNFIVGGGFFSHYSQVPLSFAWDAFGTKNGARSLTEMRDRVWRYLFGPPLFSGDTENPVFLTGTFNFEDEFGEPATLTIEPVAGQVPEPGSILLLGSGIAGLARRLRRRNAA